MARDWLPEVHVDLGTAHTIVVRQFPEFAQQEAFYLGRGWDNFCIAYASGVGFRLPTRQMGADALKGERAVLPPLVRRLPLPIPEITHRGEPWGDYPFPFLGFKVVPGRCADQVALSRSEQGGAARAMGAFLRALHGLNPADIHELPADMLAKADPQSLLLKMRNRVGSFTELGPDDHALVHRGLLTCEALAAKASVSSDRVVVHGDLYPRHVLVNEARAVCGVIDWGDVHLGHPAVDLSLAYSLLAPEARPAFWEAYGRELSPGDDALARLRAGMYGTALLAYGLDEGDIACRECGSRILEQFDR